MRIINKSLQPTVKEALLSLELKTQCLQLVAAKKGYIRGEIRKLKKENNALKFKTRVENGLINVWRLE